MFYQDDDEDYKPIYKHWSRVAREEFTRAQIVMTAKDNRDLCSPVWYAMQDELLRRDVLDLRKTMRREGKEARGGGSPYGLFKKDKPKKRLSK
jgi:hypothetical protein